MSRPIAELVAAGLRHAGVEFLFGLPGGGSNLDVIGAAEAEGLRFVLAHSEAAAVLMAAAAAELSGRPGACVVTRGPGVAERGERRRARPARPPTPPARERLRAGRGSRPHRPPAPRPRRAARSGHQGLVRPRSDVDRRGGAGGGRAEPGRAAGARPPRPRPVRARNPPRRRRTRTALAPRPTSTRSAPRCGPRAGRSSSPASARRPAGLRSLVAGSTVPVLTTYKAKGVVPETGPNAAGIATGATIEAPLLHAADLVVGVGLDPVELIPAPWPYAAPVVLLGTWPTVGDGAYFGDHLLIEVVVPDLDAALGELAPELRSEWPDGTAQDARPRRARPRAGRRARRAERRAPAGRRGHGPGARAGRDGGHGRRGRPHARRRCRCGRSTNRASC